MAAVDDAHVQPDCVVTVIVPLPPDCATVRASGLTVNVHAAAASVTVNVFPAIVTVPDRVAVAVFAAAVNPTLPAPLPLAPLEIVTHDVAVVAVQPQPVVVVTVTVPLPPAAGSDWLTGEIVNEQDAACVTVNVEPAIVSVPTRVVAAVFAATLNVTVPLPEPAAPVLTVIHVTLLAAVQAHPAPAVTVLLPVPPDAVND